MTKWRWGLALLGAGLLVGAACSSGDNDDDDDGTSAGTAAGTTSGTPAGTAAGTTSGTPAGSGGPDPCTPGSGLTPEERFRATCRLMVEHAAWGQCGADPSPSEAATICETSAICETCEYLWFGGTYDQNANCLGEHADLRCCLLPQASPYECSPDDLSVFMDVSDSMCAAEYDAYTNCM